MAKRKNNKSATDGKSTAKKKSAAVKKKKKTKEAASSKKGAAGARKGKGGKSPAARITKRIKELGDWRGETLAQIRKIIKDADPDVVEEWKYRGVPVWYHDGMLCTGETYQDHVKMTFAKGASLKDPSKLFNATLEGDTWRAVDFHEGDTVDAQALKALIREAVAVNTSG